MTTPRIDDLRLAIRELMAEEIAKLRGEQEHPATHGHEERVSLRDDVELAAFVRRLGTLYADPTARADIEAGRHRFRLAGVTASHAHGAPADGDDTSQLENRLVTEREVNALGAGTRQLLVAKTTRVTPLARDALRRRGITLTRSES